MFEKFSIGIYIHTFKLDCLPCSAIFCLLQQDLQNHVTPTLIHNSLGKPSSKGTVVIEQNNVVQKIKVAS